ncbi:MAG: SprT-like domain-containing protein [Acidobacteria bacterium]|nr:SprT-like domain-containing protein [Acidobacteriota bacterium]
MINNSEILTLSELETLYSLTFKAIDPANKTPDIELRYYPYVNVNHTIRIRSGKIFVRISSLFQFVPASVHESLAKILVSKLLGKKVPADARKLYRKFVNSESFQKIATENKRKRGRKDIISASGDHFDLDQIFGKVNLIYFQNKIPKPELTWSRKRTYRRLGHYDSVHNSITISKSLDDRNVPKFVVEYVVYHEMLHIKHPTQHRNGRRYNHTPAFKRDEANFPYFDEAENWIEKNAGSLRRKAQKGA